MKKGKNLPIVLGIIFGLILVIFLWKEVRPRVIEDFKKGAVKDSIANLATHPPTKGCGYATTDTATTLKVYLDPMKTYTRPMGKVRYILVANPDVSITENGPTNDNSGIDIVKWYSMPAEWYYVISEEPDGKKVLFKYSMEKPT
jgi:hypothetical protein